MKRRTNSAVARGIETQAPDAASWDAFDALPIEVRRALWTAPLPINPVQVAALVETGEQSTIEAVRQAAEGEMRAFALEHLRRFGYPLPHAAANVQAQPYVTPSASCRRLPARDRRNPSGRCRSA